jgi:uncharacterized damage-inducible protein DinB
MTMPEKITTTVDPALSGERADLLQTLATHRGFLRHTVRDLTDEQAAQRTTVSELCLGGLIKHIAGVESRWVKFILGGAEEMHREPVDWTTQFQMLDGESLAGLLEDYQRAAERTDEVIATLPDLNASQPLPKAPWFEPGASWSARRVVLHILAEVTQHAGHADILREALDGSKTMG